MKQNWTLTLEIYSLYCSNLEKNIDYDQISSVQLLTPVWLLATTWLQHIRPHCPPAPGACSNSCPSSRWCDPLSSPSPPAFNLSIRRVFSNESVLCTRWTKYWNFSFSISPSNEYSELIFFRIDWFEFLWPKGLSGIFSITTVQKHQFFSSQLSL